MSMKKKKKAKENTKLYCQICDYHHMVNYSNTSYIRCGNDIIDTI